MIPKQRNVLIKQVMIQMSFFPIFTFFQNILPTPPTYTKATFIQKQRGQVLSLIKAERIRKIQNWSVSFEKRNRNGNGDVLKVSAVMFINYLLCDITRPRILLLTLFEKKCQSFLSQEFCIITAKIHQCSTFPQTVSKDLCVIN